MTATDPISGITDLTGAFAGLETVTLLVPDLPKTAELLPFLEEIDANRWYSNNGPLVHRFEEELGRFIEPSESEAEKLSPVTFASGTAALEMALDLQGLKPGARVGVPAFTFPATGLAAQRSGLEVVLLDVDAESWCLAPDLASRAIEECNLEAVLPVAAFGTPLPVDSWDDCATSTGVPVVMDAAAGLGNQPIGNKCDVVFSLHATKALGVGEGGLVVTRNSDRGKQARLLANFGFLRGTTAIGGRNAKMSEYHAAVGLAQLRRFTQIRRRRLRVTRLYLSALTGINFTITHQMSPPGIVRCVLPILLPETHHAGFVEERLALAGIQTRRWYDPGLQHHEPFVNCTSFGAGGPGDLSVTRMLNDRLIGLPFHSFLERAEIERTCETLDRVLAAG